MSDFFKVQNWYPVLREHTFPTGFVVLNQDSLSALQAGVTAGDQDRAVAETISRMQSVMRNIPGNSFVFTDECAPTDTERFYGKRGAVYSAKSAWKYLALSEKIRNAAAAGKVSCIALRPFRRMSRTREFRLFIRDGQLLGASQYNLVRYFHRLDRNRENYWEILKKFFKKVRKHLPPEAMVMDVYITSADEVLIIDFNPWGPPTDPLLMRSWERDWTVKPELEIIEFPTEITGDVNVSF